MESIIEVVPYMSKIKKDSVTENNFTLWEPSLSFFR